LRGLAQPIRNLLAYTGTAFTDKHYETGPDAETFHGPWFKEKFTLGLDFPNVPYYIDGDLKISQSHAIMRYLARRHGLVATDETGLVRQDMTEQQLADIRMGFYMGFAYNFVGDLADNKAKFLNETLPPQLAQLSQFLGDNQWFTGRNINYVDFLAYEMLDWLRLLNADSVRKYDNLWQYLYRFESLPQISAHMKSSGFRRLPITATFAKWGGEAFNLRGRAQPIRTLLAYTGTAFTDKLYDSGPDAATFCDPWFKEKFTLGLDFPNVPYYIDGDLKLTHSNAIMRYLARRHGLVATDETGLVRQDMVENQLADIRMGFYMGLTYNFVGDFADNKAKFLNETLPPQLAQLSRFLGDNQWFTGHDINYVDFLAYEMLDWLRLLNAESVRKYDNLWQYLHRFESLPQISAYIKSSGFRRSPITASMATWGGDEAQPIRTLLAYTGTAFTDKQYDNGPDAATFCGPWFKEKFTLGLDFPNVPYYIDGDLKLTHSNAIMRYLARQHGLVATDETGLVRQDMVENQLWDIKNGFYMGFAYNFTGDVADNKAKLINETLPPQLAELSRFLGDNQWFTGRNINYYEYGKDAVTFRDYWLKEKFTLGLDFPNLPYYMDGDLKISQSNAILRHVGRKHGLVATDETGLVRQDMAEQQLVDIRFGFYMGVAFNFAGDLATNKAKYTTDTLPQQLADLSRFLGNNQWFTGRNINFVDFLAAYTDKRYGKGTDEVTTRDHWLSEKFTLGLDFPNVPYYIDGNLKLTQSTAILRYLGRKHGLVATDETGLVRQDMVEQQLMDIRRGFNTGVVFNMTGDLAANTANYIANTLPPQLADLSSFLGDNQWFTGRNINYVDFLAYEILNWFRQLTPETVRIYDNLWQFLVTFESLPQISAYLK
ncbi:unnamed protein product, partial [Medioppia subpectinata]